MEIPLEEALPIAFVLIFAIVSLIYAVGRLLSPKPAKNENQDTSYACGEKATFHNLKLNISLYKYLVYFIILDSSVLLVAFASFALQVLSLPLFLTYMVILLAAILLLFDGGKD
ncbi:MAG TPA: NADH-quinone oxidoreductase subunit A [Candidatus Lokiarchaeia archaeon]|nr:NADH-quinone oxidoreductase subunit A [Candidatus Lokiarchaeia archaeon]